MNSTFINQKIEAALKHISELQGELQSSQKTIEYYAEKVQEQEATRTALQTELDNVEAFVLALRGTDDPPSKEDLGQIVVELIERSDKELSAKDISEIINKDRKTVSNMMLSLERRGAIKCTREEKAIGRYPRKYYTLVERQVAGTK